MEKKAYMRPTLIAEKFDAQVFFAACKFTTEHEFILDKDVQLETSTNVLIDEGNDKLFSDDEHDIRGTDTFNSSKDTPVKFIGWGWEVGNGMTQIKQIESQIKSQGIGWLYGRPYVAVVENPGTGSTHIYAVKESYVSIHNMS